MWMLALADDTFLGVHVMISLVHVLGDAMNQPEVLTVLVNMMQDFTATKLMSLADLEQFCSLGEQGIKTNIHSGVHQRNFFIHELLLEYVVNIINQPVVSLLDIESVEQERHSAPEQYPKLSFKELVTRMGTDTPYEVCIAFLMCCMEYFLLYGIFSYSTCSIYCMYCIVTAQCVCYSTHTTTVP